MKKPQNGHNPADRRKVPSFTVPDRTTVLSFQGTDWEGAEVVMRLNISIATYLTIKGMTGDDADPIALAQTFGDTMLKEWNLVNDDGKPVPATGAGLTSLPDMTFVLRIVTLGLEAMAAVPAPLVMPSVDGSRLVEASTALETG